MRRKSLLSALIAIGTLSMTLQSCLNDDDDNIDMSLPTALVTVRPNPDGSFIMQLDNVTQLIPNNLTQSPFGTKEVRALVNYTENGNHGPNDNVRNVRVNWIDSICTKLPVKSLGEDNDIKFGNDPIEIINDWVTVAEDGYLTLRIRTLWGDTDTRHIINLLADTNPDNPYELEIKHDAQGDAAGHWGDALIAFNLNGLPRPDDDKATITLKWKSFTGSKTAEFKLQMRPDDRDIDTDNILYTSSLK